MAWLMWTRSWTSRAWIDGDNTGAHRRMLESTGQLVLQPRERILAMLSSKFTQVTSFQRTCPRKQIKANGVLQMYILERLSRSQGDVRRRQLVRLQEQWQPALMREDLAQELHTQGPLALKSTMDLRHPHRPAWPLRTVRIEYHANPRTKELRPMHMLPKRVVRERSSHRSRLLRNPNHARLVAAKV